MRIRRAGLPSLAGCAALFAVLAVAGSTDAAEPLLVTVDQARVMRISEPADTVIVGNPAIADATIRDRQTLIITGHSFGTTNLIVLDKQGQQIADQLLTVQSQEGNLVTVFKRSTRETFSCVTVCEPMLNVGDSSEVFRSTSEQIQARTSLAQSNP